MNVATRGRSREVVASGATIDYAHCWGVIGLREMSVTVIYAASSYTSASGNRCPLSSVALACRGTSH